jgi:chromosome partitioning protein
MTTSIITFATIKGGAGKTTLATNLAVEFSKNKKTSLIIDCDYKQGSSYQWFEKRDNDENLMAMEAFSIETLEKIILTAKENSIDHVVIDTAGSDDNLVNKAIELSDYCIIPCGAGGFDIPSQKKTVDIVKKLKKKSSIILTKCVSTSNDEKNARLVLSGLGVNISKCKTTLLQAYKDAALFSQSVTELNQSSKASQEISEIYQWIIKKLKPNSLLDKMENAVNE